MDEDAIYNFFNNPVTQDSVRILDRYILEKDMDTESVRCALERLINQIPLNQQASILNSWSDRIKNCNPKPAMNTRNPMHIALDALQRNLVVMDLMNRTNLANARALQASSDAQSALQSNARMQLALTLALPTVGGSIAGSLMAASGFTLAAVGQGAFYGFGTGVTLIAGEEAYNLARGNSTLIQEANLLRNRGS